MSDLAYIYLIQDGKDKGSHIYKIGKTIQKGGDSRKINRIQQYSKGTIVINIFNTLTEQIDLIENNIKRLFKNKYNLVRGSEWFEGDLYQMSNDIYHIINENNKEYGKREEPQNNLQCIKCQKIFSTKWYYKIHSEKCTGTKDPYSCKYCQKKFTHEKSRYSHYRICKAKIDDSKEEVSTIKEDTILEISEPDKVQFLRDHITNEMIINILQNKNHIETFIKYINCLFERKGNQCVRKTNLRATYSQIYIGNNKWETRLDQTFYPRLLESLANVFIIHIQEQINTQTISTEPIITFLKEIIACSLPSRMFIRDDILKNFRAIIREIKLIVFDKKQPLSAPSARGRLDKGFIERME